MTGNEPTVPAGDPTADQQIDELICAIGYVSEIIKGAGQVRWELNPDLATELEHLAMSIDEASTTFLVSDAGSAILSGPEWPEDPDL